MVTCACILTSKRSTLGHPLGFTADWNALLPLVRFIEGANRFKRTSLETIRTDAWSQEFCSRVGFTSREELPTTARLQVPGIALPRPRKKLRPRPVSRAALAFFLNSQAEACCHLVPELSLSQTRLAPVGQPSLSGTYPTCAGPLSFVRCLSTPSMKRTNPQFRYYA